MQGLRQPAPSAALTADEPSPADRRVGPPAVPLPLTLAPGSPVDRSGPVAVPVHSGPPRPRVLLVPDAGLSPPPGHPQPSPTSDLHRRHEVSQTMFLPGAAEVEEATAAAGR